MTGTGKTILAIEHYIRFYQGEKILLVAPASKLKEQGFQRTIDEYLPEVEYETCSYHMLSKKWKDYKDYFVIFDEVHNAKKSTGVHGKAAFKLTQISKGFICLSATPLSNGWIDSVNLFKMFGLTPNKTQFLKKHANQQLNYWGALEIVSWKNENVLKYMWSKISLRLNKDDAIDLPDLVFKEIHFKTSAVYKTIQKKKIHNGIAYDNSMKLRHGLRCYTSLEDKIKYIKDFIESTNENILIFYNYDEELELLKEVTDKKIFICNGQQKEFPLKGEWANISNTVTLANYKSGSEGIEFTYCSILIFFSPTDSYTEYYQALGRINRTGQTKKMTVYKFITEKTIETDIYKALDNKQDFNFDIWYREEK